MSRIALALKLAAGMIGKSVLYLIIGAALIWVPAYFIGVEQGSVGWVLLSGLVVSVLFAIHALRDHYLDHWYEWTCLRHGWNPRDVDVQLKLMSHAINELDSATIHHGDHR